jgi:alanine dehydrogenase
MASVVARSASQMLGHAALPFTLALANEGLEAALRSHPALRRGVATHQGRVVSAQLAFHLGLPEVTL